MLCEAKKDGADDVEEAVAAARAAGRDGDAAGAAWVDAAELKTFPDLVRELVSAEKRAAWEACLATTPSLAKMRDVATSLGVTPYFDWDAPRAREGYYRVSPSTEYAIARAKAFAPHSDLLWMETAEPDVQQARAFAQRVREAYPEQWLAYNLSPSFNWDAGGLFDDDSQIEAFTGDLAEAGYVWQFITLAGFHSNGLATHNFVRDYASRGMRAYVETIQRAERDTGAPILKHQTWSGAELMDTMQGLATGGGSSTASMGAGVTEDQFGEAPDDVAADAAGDVAAALPLPPSGFLPTSRTDALKGETKHHARAALKNEKRELVDARLAAKSELRAE
mmetsp:Transcript_29781/g.89600  ORF Transcript_29781/g.89600 Transcript_29781/m.89600 type:complete len:336 (+) Transcript_29781:204-1211(+)